MTLDDDAAYRRHFSEYRRKQARKRRRRLKRRKLCVNAISHGAPVDGCTKCERCQVVHARSR